MRELLVLLVEDNQLLRWWMVSNLQREGFSVLAPPSVEEAMSMAASTPVHVLITDWRLAHGHKGSEVLTLVRRKSPLALAILISAEAGAELSDHARANGFDIVIQKPFPLAEIVDSVHRLALRGQSEVAS